MTKIPNDENLSIIKQTEQKPATIIQTKFAYNHQIHEKIIKKKQSKHNNGDAQTIRRNETNQKNIINEKE